MEDSRPPGCPGQARAPVLHFPGLPHKTPSTSPLAFPPGMWYLYLANAPDRWVMKLVTAAEMRELDRRAIEELGLHSLVLMENAGRTTYQVLRREFPQLAGPVAVLAGRGNNGGDGYVVARYLANAGVPVTVFLVAARDQVQGDALVNLKILEQMGLEVAEVREESHLNEVGHRLARSALLVDALLGTGINSEVRGLMRTLMEKIGRAHV